MPDAEGDNANVERACGILISSLLPVLTLAADHLDIPLSVGIIRMNLTLGIVKLS